MMSILNVPIILILARLSKNQILSGKPCQTSGWQALAFWCSESHRSGARGRPDAPPPLDLVRVVASLFGSNEQLPYG